MPLLLGTPLIGKILTNLDKRIASKGYVFALQEILGKAGCKVEIKGKSGKLRKLLKEEAVLIVANHPSEADVLVLLSTIEQRDDAYLVMNSSFRNICPSFNKHIIPVYITHNLINENKSNLKLKLLKRIHQTEDFSKEEAQTKNRESISKAAVVLDNKGLVAIFPGAGANDGSWKSGVGHLIKQIQKKEQVSIVMAYISGTSNGDYFRFIPGLSFLLPKLRIRFSKPMQAAEVDYEDGKMIASALESKYKSWTSQFTGKRLSYYPMKYYYLFRSLVLWVFTKMGTGS